MPTISRRPAAAKTIICGLLSAGSSPHSAWRADLGLRVRVWWRTNELDRALASGQQPAGSPQLELRVQQLASVRVRWGLAHRVQRLVATAERPPGAQTLSALSSASPVIAAREALLDLADALTDPACTSVRGVARVSCLVCDGDNSPLHRARGEVLRRVAYEAIAMLRATE